MTQRTPREQRQGVQPAPMLELGQHRRGASRGHLRVPARHPEWTRLPRALPPTAPAKCPFPHWRARPLGGVRPLGGAALPTALSPAAAGAQDPGVLGPALPGASPVTPPACLGASLGLEVRCTEAQAYRQLSRRTKLIQRLLLHRTEVTGSSTTEGKRAVKTKGR